MTMNWFGTGNNNGATVIHTSPSTDTWSTTTNHLRTENNTRVTLGEEYKEERRTSKTFGEYHGEERDPWSLTSSVTMTGDEEKGICPVWAMSINRLGKGNNEEVAFREDYGVKNKTLERSALTCDTKGPMAPHGLSYN